MSITSFAAWISANWECGGSTQISNVWAEARSLIFRMCQMRVRKRYFCMYSASSARQYLHCSRQTHRTSNRNLIRVDSYGEDGLSTCLGLVASNNWKTTFNPCPASCRIQEITLRRTTFYLQYVSYASHIIMSCENVRGDDRNSWMFRNIRLATTAHQTNIFGAREIHRRIDSQTITLSINGSGWILFHLWKR